MKSIISVAVSVIFSLCATASLALTLDIADDGQLHGASGVDVGGTFYDVVFKDDTCANLYSGCDEVSDFTFQTEADANAASQALLGQVLLDGSQGDFDSDSALTFGCEDEKSCGISTPYGPGSQESPGLSLSVAVNRSTGEGDDFVFSGTDIWKNDGGADANTGQWPNGVIAVWTQTTPVPVPAGLPLLVSATAILALIRRRQRA